MKHVHSCLALLLTCALLSGCSADGPAGAAGSDAGSSDASDPDAGGCGTYLPGTPPDDPGGTPMIDFMNFGNGIFKMPVGDTRTVDGVTLTLNAAGDLQVLDGANNVLWHANKSASCAPDKCNLVFQGDGNVVLYGPSGAYWSTGTFGNVGKVLTLSSHPPYLSVRDGSFKVVWSSGGPDTAPNIQVPRGAGPRAAKVRDFLDSLGINSHMDQSGMSADTLLKMLDYLHVRFMRDGWRSDGSLAGSYKTLAAHDIHFNMILSDPYDMASFTGPETLAALSPGRLVSVEGPNEINNFPFSCNGTKSTPGAPNDNGALAQCFMSKAYAYVHSDPKLGGVAVNDLTWAFTKDAEKYGLLDLPGRADFGNMHFYTLHQPYRWMLPSFAGLYHHVFPSQAVITETGYATTDVSYTAQALMVVNTYLDAFQHGFQRTYVYELYDEWQDYGLFDKTFAPKPAATAVHNLTSILADDGTLASTDSLGYSVTGMPAEGHALLLQKSNRDFYLVLWNEAEVYQNGADVNVPPSPVTVDFGATFAQGAVFSPIDGAEAVQQLSCASSVQLGLGSKPLVVMLHP